MAWIDVVCIGLLWICVSIPATLFTCAVIVVGRGVASPHAAERDIAAKAFTGIEEEPHIGPHPTNVRPPGAHD